MPAQGRRPTRYHTLVDALLVTEVSEAVNSNKTNKHKLEHRMTKNESTGSVLATVLRTVGSETVK